MARKIFLAAGLLTALIVACTETNEPPADSADAGVLAVDGAGGSSSGEPAGRDSSANDASTGDAAKDGSGADGAPSDSGRDSGPDSGTDSGDTGTDGPTATTNVAGLGVATATSTYSASYPAASANDGVASNSWYAAAGSCATNPDGGPDFVCSGAPTHVAIALANVQTIGRVKVLGNRDSFPSGYDVLTARIELLDGADAVIYTADVTMSRGAEPNGDVEHVITPAKAGVKTIRVVVLTGEASGPGLAEVEAYAK
jgi:hypothetical protein